VFAMRARKVDAGWGRWDLALGLEEAGLEIDDVVAQLVVLVLEGLVELAELLELLDLVLELLDVLFFALAEGTLDRLGAFKRRCGMSLVPGQRGSGQRVSM